MAVPFSGLRLRLTLGETTCRMACTLWYLPKLNMPYSRVLIEMEPE